MAQVMRRPRPGRGVRWVSPRSTYPPPLPRLWVAEYPGERCRCEVGWAWTDQQFRRAAPRGGVGMTWEHDLQLYFKRAKASEVAFGDAIWHRERVARLFNP